MHVWQSSHTLDCMFTRDALTTRRRTHKENIHVRVGSHISAYYPTLAFKGPGDTGHCSPTSKTKRALDFGSPLNEALNPRAVVTGQLQHQIVVVNLRAYLGLFKI